MIVHDFFGIDFRIELFIDFSWKVAPKMDPQNVSEGSVLVPFSRPFPKVDFWMHFGRPLVRFWLHLGAVGLHFGALGLHFGALWLPFGSLWLTLAPFWLPLGSLWVAFGSLLAPFGSLWVPVGSLWLLFGSLWLTFCSFWLTFTPFSHFGRLLASFLVPFRYFQRKSNEKSCFFYVFL